MNTGSSQKCLPFIVVSGGPFHAVRVVFLPLEYILSVPPHSTYVIVDLVVCSHMKRYAN